MGKFFSKDIIHSIDVSGHNNRVWMLCGVPVNISIILEDVTKHILRENKRITINVALISLIIAMILTILTISMVVSCYIKCLQEHSNLMFEQIRLRIHDVNIRLSNDMASVNRHELNGEKKETLRTMKSV